MTGPTEIVAPDRPRARREDGARRLHRPASSVRLASAVAAAVAGPITIVGAVLIVLRLFAFGGLLSHQYPDVLPFWLPTYCFLGKTLAAGHIAAWNPHVMGGAPFAADPQSGWLYLPAMTLFTALGCGTAIRWFIVLQPLLAGLGLYGFLRSERASRAASTVGGLALAMPLAGSYLSLNLPFAGTLAWTAVALAVLSRVVRARTWSTRLLWLVALGITWTQLAASNLSDGLVIGTGAMAAYLVPRLVADLRARTRGGRETLLVVVALAVGLPLVGLAFFVPRFAYLPRTSIGQGYRRLFFLSKALTGNQTFGLVFGKGVGPTWPVRLALTPGAYLGLTALALAFAGWRSPRLRAVAIGFAVYAGICYVLMLEHVAKAMPAFFRNSNAGGFYFHDPSRFRFGLLVGLAVLAGIGVDAWRVAGRWWERLALVVPGVLVWCVLPWEFGNGRPTHIFWFGLAAGAVALALTAWRGTLAAVVPAVLAVELCMNGLAGQVPKYQLPAGSLPYDPLHGPINTLLRPDVRADVYVRRDQIVQYLERAGLGRYLSYDPSIYDPRGYHVRQRSWFWGLLGMQQSMLFGDGLEEGQGYNPAQELRYWSFVRAVEDKAIRYNGAAFVHPPPVALNLLQVRWLVGRTNGRGVPLLGSRIVLRDGHWSLWSVPNAAPRASVLTAWRIVGSRDAALTAVRSASFDPDADAVVEERPSFASRRAGAANRNSDSASFRWIGLDSARVDLVSAHPAVVLVRNSYDPHWHASVDGAPAKVLAADLIDQGIAVGAGRHEIVLTYDDPTVGYGLAGSAVAIAAAVGLALWLRVRRRAGGDPVTPASQSVS